MAVVFQILIRGARKLQSLNNSCRPDQPYYRSKMAPSKKPDFRGVGEDVHVEVHVEVPGLGTNTSNIRLE